MNDSRAEQWAARSQLIGRDAAQQALLTVLLGFDDMQSPGALLVGDSGTGKTSVLCTLDASVPGLLHIRSRVGDRLVPYASLARWLRQVLQALSGEPDAHTRQGLSALLPELLDVRAGRAGHGDSIRVDAPAPLGPPDTATVHALLAQCQPHVSAWAWDDLHLSDDATAEWLLRLVTQAPPAALPWILSTPPPEAGSVVEALLEAAAGVPAVRSVLLAPLNAQQLDEWLTQHALPPSIHPQQAVQQLMLATGGSPLHLKLLLEDPQGISWPQADEPWPGVSPLMGQRLQRLGPLALAVARACAVGGQDASEAAVMDFTGLQAAELDTVWAELRAAELWGHQDFSHHRVREAARAATPEPQARQLHAHFAQWLQAHGGQPARAAAHWQAAGEPVRALPALREAAQYAQRLLSMPERLACLVRAADIAEEHGQLDLAFDCCCEAFEAHTESVRHTQGTRMLAQMKRLARSPRQHARALTQVAWHAMVHGHLEAAIDTAQQALALADEEADGRLIAPARMHLGTALGVAGQLERALPLLRASEDWVNAEVPPDERASFHGNLAAVLDNLGQRDAARRHHLNALSLAARHSNDAHRATLLANYAHSRLEAGDPIGGRELALKSQVLVQRAAPEGSTAGFIAVLMAPCERSLGRYIAALDWCDRAEHILAERNPARMPVAHLQRAHVWMDLGLHERALRLLAGPGLPLGRQLPQRHAVPWLLLLARAQVRCGIDPHAALQEAREKLPGEGWPELRWWLDAEVALVQPGELAAPELKRVAQGASGAGLLSVALGAWLQCALLAASGTRSIDLAREAAEAALALMGRGVEASQVDRALRWLAPASALAACGELQRARGLLLRGQHWLRNTCAEQVPPLAQQSLTQLHPLNLMLSEMVLPER